MDQAELEDQIICRHGQECGADANMDRNVYLSDLGVYQVPVEVKEKHAANSAVIAT